MFFFRNQICLAAGFLIFVASPLLAEDEPKPGAAPNAQKIDPLPRIDRRKVSRKVSFEFVDTPLLEALTFLQTLVKVGIILDPVVAKGVAERKISLRMTNIPLDEVLDKICKEAGLAWDTRGPVYISTPEGLRATDALPANPPSPDEIAKLVQQLVGEGFANRELASRRLTELGVSALPALKAAAQNKDPEVSARAAKIIESIEKPKALLEAMVRASSETYEGYLMTFDRGLTDIEFVYLWSCRWMEAQRAATDKEAGRLEARASHLARMQKLQQFAEQRLQSGQVSKREASAAKYYYAEAERSLLLAKAHGIEQ